MPILGSKVLAYRPVSGSASICCARSCVLAGSGLKMYERAV
jgi:hypothetical protein